MRPLRITHKKIECIGCALCAELAPDYWSMDENGEAQLCDPLRADRAFQYASALEEDRARLEAVEDGCPVSIIRIG